MIVVDYEIHEYLLFFVMEESEESFFELPDESLSKERDNPPLPKASDFPPGTAFVINEFDVPLVSVPDTAKGSSEVSWFNWYGGFPRPYDPSHLKPGDALDADSFEEWVGIVEASLKRTSANGLRTPRRLR